MNTKNMEYRVKILSESGIGNIVFGESKLPVKRMEMVMNQFGEQGWRVAHQIIEQRRFLFLFKREVVIITFEREAERS